MELKSVNELNKISDDNLKSKIERQLEELEKITRVKITDATTEGEKSIEIYIKDFDDKAIKQFKDILTKRGFRIYNGFGFLTGYLKISWKKQKENQTTKIDELLALWNIKLSWQEVFIVSSVAMLLSCAILGVTTTFVVSLIALIGYHKFIK